MAKQQEIASKMDETQRENEEIQKSRLVTICFTFWLFSEFFTKKQIVGQSNVLMKDLTPRGKEVLQKLLGKAENPMSTLVEGTVNLSSQVRFTARYLFHIRGKVCEQQS